MTESPISEDMVRDVARLARLDPSPQEVQDYRAHLEAILGYVRQLDQLNLDGVEPTSHVHTADAPLRHDNPRACLTPAEALSQAPDSTGEGFGVPKVLEGQP